MPNAFATVFLMNALIYHEMEILIRFIAFNLNEGEISSMKKGDALKNPIFNVISYAVSIFLHNFASVKILQRTDNRNIGKSTLNGNSEESEP